MKYKNLELEILNTQLMMKEVHHRVDLMHFQLKAIHMKIVLKKLKARVTMTAK